MADERVRVLVVDDHPVVRRGLAALLSDEPWVRALDQAGTVADALRVATLECPDVAVVDLRLPDGDGVELIRQLVRAVPGCRCLALTMDTAPARVRDVLDAGASGYLIKDSEPELVLDAVRTVLGGGIVVSPGLTATMTSRAADPTDGLTDREREIALLVADGLDNAAIARRTGLADKTVRNVVSNVLVKLGARDRVNLALLLRGDRPQR